MLYSIPFIIQIDIVLLCLHNTKDYRMFKEQSKYTDLVLELVVSLDCDVGIHLDLRPMVCYILTTKFATGEGRRWQFNKQTSETLVIAYIVTIVDLSISSFSI